MNILENLLAIDNILFNWIVRNTPTTDAQREEMKKVDAARTRINHLYNALVLDQLNGTLRDLPEQAAELDRLSVRIAATATDIDKAKQVLAVAAQVIAVAAQVIAMVAV